jgi:hypothetical protein
MYITKNCILTAVLLGFTIMFSSFALPAFAAETTIELGSVSKFGLLGDSITNTNPTSVHGDVGSTVQTLIPTITNGSNFLNDAAYFAANADLDLSIDDANARACLVHGQADVDLGGKTLSPGIFCYPGDVQVNGSFNLSGSGVYIFKIAGEFNTAANAMITLSNGANAADVFFVVKGDSTIRADTDFTGTLMSRSPITVDSSNIKGRILSQSSVTIS